MKQATIRMTLGSTGIKTAKNGFGALPIQRISKEDAVKLLRRAYENGITFYDTAHAYTDSEEKLGMAFGEAGSGMRERVYLATKTDAGTGEGLREQLALSLERLKTTYIDLYQLHNPAVCPRLGDGSGLYEALLEAKKSGKVRHIGITQHRFGVAEEAVESGLYETLQFPFSYLTGERELRLVELCREKNMGFLAMKGMSGGLIRNSAAAFAFMMEHDNVLPIWGVQKPEELEEFLSYDGCPPVMTAELAAVVEADRKELAGEFCRGCGYCLPCPAGIEIANAARISLMLRRAPSEAWLTEEYQEKMKRVEDCIHCGHCAAHCPYGLDTPALLAKNYADYKTFL